jgi:hypothetical protein
MSRNRSPRRITGDSGEGGGRLPAKDAEQGAAQVSAAVTREHTAKANQVRHEPMKSSHHSEDEDADPHDSEDE